MNNVTSLTSIDNLIVLHGNILADGTHRLCDNCHAVIEHWKQYCRVRVRECFGDPLVDNIHILKVANIVIEDRAFHDSIVIFD